MTDRTRFALRDGMELTGATLDEIWWRYAAIGGQAGPALLVERIAGPAACDAVEHDVIAQALNECFMDRGLTTSPVGYASVRTGVPRLARSRPRPAHAVCGADEARRRAREAQLRSATAARQTAELQLVAARLMQASGQLTYAGRARARAERARALAAALGQG